MANVFVSLLKPKDANYLCTASPRYLVSHKGFRPLINQKKKKKTQEDSEKNRGRSGLKGGRKLSTG